MTPQSVRKMSAVAKAMVKSGIFIKHKLLLWKDSDTTMAADGDKKIKQVGRAQWWLGLETTGPPPAATPEK
ncbi:hypothetical protein E2C01_030062 [Portunus trituberculatus]|uniref:Uncharacterized protein n=1 Tax=Portunus trituberculatus TaxID=210409 RepID=A0A5B7EPI1_PORTR|nr:hypothetical protein [Portunus trituberculatus]